MKTLTTLCALTLASLINTATAAPMDSHLHTALVDTCKSAISNNTLHFKRTLKSYRLNEATIAHNLVCNGESVIDFASRHNAHEIALRLSAIVGTTSITDLAQIETVTYEVSFNISAE
ncbi:DUF3718 domain-containing protein [Thalassotalea maritima]|uniref:DUF3718 domain-containing protein n=1 Tax=Thalassotalea maritima TaxID=3242416 RepID=UPI00352732FC